MDRKEKLNLSMLFDFYEMTMSNGYFRKGMKDCITYFDIFFRRVPDGGGFARYIHGGYGVTIYRHYFLLPKQIQATLLPNNL